MPETYFVTGGTGLAGHHVLRELIDRELEADQIIAYDIDPREENIADIRDEITLVQGDITDETQLFEAFERFRPTRVLHLAALLVYDGRRNPKSVIEVNCLGTANVFDASRIYDATRCVYASSASVYGSIPGTNSSYQVHETDPVKPDGTYGATKYLNETLGRQYHEQYKPDYIGVRIGGAWGRGRLSGSTGEFTSALRDAALGQPITLPDAWMDIFGQTGDIYASYGKDIGRWFTDLLETDGAVHPVYNQRNKKPFTLTEVATILEERVPGTTVRFPDCSNKSPGSPPPVLDASRWYEQLGFIQRWDIESAIIDYANHHRRSADLPEL